MKSSALPRDHLFLFLLVVLIVGVPTVFLRSTYSTFDIPQLTVLWVVAIGVLLTAVYTAVVSGRPERIPRTVVVAMAGFLFALALTTVLSPQPWVAFTGLTVRGAGALTYALGVGLLYAVFAFLSMLIVLIFDGKKVGIYL